MTADDHPDHHPVTVLMAMPGYGHPLRFGVSLTPRHDAADAVVTLAQRCERLGYDLVTFQDHP